MISSVNESPALPGLEANAANTVTPEVVTVPNETFSLKALEKRGKLLSRFEAAVQSADQHLTLNGNKGKVRIVLTLDMEAQGFARLIGSNIETKAAKLQRWDTFFTAESQNGELKLVDTAPPTKKKGGRKKKDEPSPESQAASEEAEGLPSPSDDGQDGEGDNIVPFEEGFEPAEPVEPVDLQTA